MSALPDPSLPWPIPLAAVALIAEFEGCWLRAYRCPAGVWTIGWGETEGVHPGDTCTRAQADQWLLEDLTSRTKAVEALCTRPPSRNELGALVSLAYNIGLGDDTKNPPVPGLCNSTALRQHNAGKHEAAARAICLWDKARVNGVLTTLAGLTARRAREQALYLTPDVPATSGPLPQAVEAESSLAKSPIAQGGSAITVAGVVAAAAEAKEALGPVGEALQSAKHVLADVLGVPPSWVFPMLAIACGVLIFRARLKQRREGWA